jgi:FkbM family methyltransferase
MSSAAGMGLAARAVTSLLRLPGRTYPLPGWFPLVVERLHPLLERSTEVDVAIKGARMHLDLRDYAQRRIYYLAHEGAELRFIESFLRPGDLVLDVGAHVGLFSLASSARVGPTGEVHSFEPAPPNFASLECNVRLNHLQNIRLNPVAVGTSDEVVEIGRPREDFDGAQTSGAFTVGGPEDRVEVEMIDLARYVRDRLGDKRIRLVKVDVEGFEPQVLEALDESMQTGSPQALLLEVNVPALQLHGHDVESVARPLKRNGYSLFRLTHRRRLRPCKRLPAPSLRAEADRGGPLVRGWRMRHWVYNVVALAPGVSAGHSGENGSIAAA